MIDNIPFQLLVYIYIFLFLSTKIGSKSDMTNSWAARLCRLPQARTFLLLIT